MKTRKKMLEKEISSPYIDSGEGRIKFVLSVVRSIRRRVRNFNSDMPEINLNADDSDSDEPDFTAL